MDMVFTQEEIFKLSSYAIILILFCVVRSLLAREFVKTSLIKILKEEFDVVWV